MNYNLLDLSQKNIWNNYLNKLPIDQQDIYFTPEYYRLYEENGNGKAHCFAFEKNGEIALYPFLMNSVNELGYILDGEYYDIQGAYGYNGVISSSYDEGFRTSFYNCLEEYCKKNNIIAEFIRFNPIFKNHEFCIVDPPIYVLDNVLIDLQSSIDDIWVNSFDNGVRKAIKKGIRNQLRAEIFLGKQLSTELLDTFISIYYSTMNRNSADDYFYFNKIFFKNLIDQLGENSLFTFVYKGEQIISVELNLFSGISAYGFLGGTFSEYYKYSPNSFLRFELIKYLKKQGIMNYSIGGGHSKADNIFKYKKSFSKNIESKFYIGKKIHNEQVYNTICEIWEEKYPQNKEKYNFFLLKYKFIK